MIALINRFCFYLSVLYICSNNLFTYSRTQRDSLRISNSLFGRCVNTKRKGYFFCYMAKRFTDTDKWKKPFIRGLQGAYKLLWFYICDDCDHAGIWQVDIEVAQLRIGEKVTAEKAAQNFGEKIIFLDGGSKWFIPSFIDFQYPSGLNPDNKAHGGIIKILSKYDLLDNDFKVLTSPLQGAKEMDMVKDMVMEKVKDKEKPKKNVSKLFRETEFFDLPTFSAAFDGTKYESANMEYYHESILNWSDSKGEKKLDWIAAAKGWMIRDIKENKFIDKNFKHGNKDFTKSNGQPGTSEARIAALKNW